MYKINFSAVWVRKEVLSRRQQTCQTVQRRKIDWHAVSLHQTVTKIMFSATAGVVCPLHQVAAVCSSSTRLNTLAASWSTLPLCVFVFVRSGRCWRDAVKNVADCAVRLRHPGAVVSAWKGLALQGSVLMGFPAIHILDPLRVSFPAMWALPLRPLAHVLATRNVALCRLSSCLRLSVRIILKKIKFTLEQATKAQRGSRGIALLFL